MSGGVDLGPRRATGTRGWAPVAVVVACQAVAAWLVSRGPREQALVLILTLVAVVAVVAVTTARPAPMLLAILVVVPLQTVLQARLYGFGLPGGAVSDAGAWKELVLVALVLALATGVASVVERTVRAAADELDQLAIALVAIASLYFAVGAAVPGLFPAAPSGVEVLSRSLRTNVAFLVAFVAARRVRWGDPGRVVTPVLVVGLVMAVGGVLESQFNGVWRDLVDDWAGVTRFAREVLRADVGGSVRVAVDDGYGESTIRVGSFLFSPLTVGFYLLVPLALAMVRFVRRPGPASAAVATTCGAAILFTGTRSAALAAAVTVIGVSLAVPSSWMRERGRTSVLVAGAIVAGLVGASMTGVGARFAGVLTGDEPSAAGHRERLVSSLESIAAHPFGLGLASGPTVAQSDLEGPAVISENAYVQVGNELGVLAMLVFVALVVQLVRALYRQARRPDAGVLEGGIAAASLGLAVGGLFLHVWTSVPTALTFWILAGVVLRHDPSRSQA